MNLFPTRLVGPAVLSVAVLASLAAPAHAESETVRDKRHDVQALSMADDPESEPTLTPAPGVADPDIVRTHINHRRNRLVVRMKLRQAQARPHMQVAYVRTKEHRFEIISTVGAGFPKSVDIMRGNGRAVSCDGADVTYNRDLGLLTTVVPRSCLSDPRWVRVGAAVMKMNWAMDMWIDEARGASFDLEQEQPTLGPRLRRG